MKEGNFELIPRLVILVCFCFGSSNSEDESRQTFVVRYKDGEQTIPVTVVLDYKKQTEYVINMNPRAPAKSVTLYDFKQRTIAYKDLTNRECFLGRLTYETLNEESSALHDVQSPVESKPKIRSLDPETPALTPTEIRNIAGQKIAVFCRKMNTWLLVPEKTHGIHKRDANDFEERTYEHHGTHTVHYSHYGKETRRRYRNPNSKHSPHRRQSSANFEQQGIGISEHKDVDEDSARNVASPYLTKLYNLNITNIENNLSINDTYDANLPVVHKPLSHHFSNYGENSNSEVSSRNKIDSDQSRVHKNHFGYQLNYPTFKAEFVTSDSSVIKYPPQSNVDIRDNTKPKAYETSEIHATNSEVFKEPVFPTNTVGLFGGVISKNNINIRTERATSTTDIPSLPYNSFVNHPHVHPSLQHLLPLYKPLNQEFNFDSAYVHENETETDVQNKERNVESDFSQFLDFVKGSNENLPISNGHHNESLENPDVSTNVLEVQRIKSRFENISVDEKYEPREIPRPIPHHNYLENHSLIPRENSTETDYREGYLESKNFLPVESLRPNKDENILLQKKYSNRNSPESLPHFFTTSEMPTDTTLNYFPVEKSSDIVAPAFHSTFGNTEDLSSFQILPPDGPNHHDNSIYLKNNSTLDHKTQEKKNYNTFIVTTEYPKIDKRNKFNSHHRSDLPSGEGDSKSPSLNYVQKAENRNVTPFSANSEVRANFITPAISNKTANESLLPYQIKYQNVLRDFKPDEIVIDVGNIPTQTPPPVASSFQQRRPAIQRLAPPLPENAITSDNNGWNDQVLGTTWRSFIPTTRLPRQRFINRGRRPNPSTAHLHPRNNLVQQNQHQLTHIQRQRQINQLNRLHEFQSARFNRHQAFYPNRVNPPYYSNIPNQANQINHFNQLGNLPPGVSVHPRHPQAPYADMVLSNRPPTMPLIADRTISKLHRQRHHRNKEHLQNSCCRLRGKPNSFQSCCRNGGPCCTSARRRLQPQGSSCCSPAKTVDQIIPANQIQPPLRNDEALRNKESCQREKMCRTLYESTQKVMVCRNAHIEGC